MERQIIDMRGEPSPTNNLVSGFLDLIEYVQNYRNSKEMSVLEVGSYGGECSVLMAQHFGSVLCIDLWDYIQKDYEYVSRSIGIDDTDANVSTYMRRVYESFLDRTKSFPNISHLKISSQDTPLHLNGQKFDLIYLDSEHSYEFVKQEIERFLPLVRPGGFISGHDYAEVHPVTNMPYSGVVQAVNDFFPPDQTFSDFSWIKRV